MAPMTNDERETLRRIESEYKQQMWAAADAMRAYNRRLSDILRDKMHLQEDYARGVITAAQYEAGCSDIDRRLVALADEYAGKVE